ncbi:hypothetical protein ACWEK5_20725 [Rhodococcus koreensis]
MSTLTTDTTTRQAIRIDAAAVILDLEEGVAAPNKPALAHPRSVLAHHSRLAGIASPIDGPTPDTDPDLLRTAVADLAWAQRTVAELGEDGARVRDGSDPLKLARAMKLPHLGTLFDLTPPPHPGAAERCSA